MRVSIDTETTLRPQKGLTETIPYKQLPLRFIQSLNQPRRLLSKSFLPAMLDAPLYLGLTITDRERRRRLRTRAAKLERTLDFIRRALGDILLETTGQEVSPRTADSRLGSKGNV